MQWIKWIIGFVCFIGLGLTGFFFWKKYEKKTVLKLQRRKLKDEVLGAKNYQDLVLLWKLKHNYLTEFPHLRGPFEKFETVLNKYQFKPSQSEVEQVDAMNAYKEFYRQVEGGFNGV